MSVRQKAKNPHAHRPVPLRSQRPWTPGFAYKRGNAFSQMIGTARRVLADGDCDFAQELAGKVQRLAKKSKEIAASARLQRGVQRCVLKQFKE